MPVIKCLPVMFVAKHRDADSLRRKRPHECHRSEWAICLAGARRDAGLGPVMAAETVPNEEAAAHQDVPHRRRAPSSPDEAAFHRVLESAARARGPCMCVYLLNVASRGAATGEEASAEEGRIGAAVAGAEHKRRFQSIAHSITKNARRSRAETQGPIRKLPLGPSHYTSVTVTI